MSGKITEGLEHQAKKRRAIYRAWTGERAAQLPLFFQPWWLDAVCGAEKWNCCIAPAGGDEPVQGLMPYHLTRRLGLRWNRLPPLTPFLGPLLDYPPEVKPAQRYAFEKRVYTQLIDQLPRAPFMVTKFHYGVTNWLPFYWRGFHQRTHYSYVLEPLGDPQRLFDNFKGSVRTDLRRAESCYRVELSDDWPLLYDLSLRVFDRQSIAPPFSRVWFGGLDKVLHARGQRRIYLVRRKEEAGPVAAVYTVHDAQSAYLLLTGRSKEAGSGAVALLIWQAIQDYCDMGIPRFDFEGSMLPGVEHFFRGFGGELKPYFRVVNKGYWRLEALRAGL